MKGMVDGMRSDAFAAPPPLDLSPTDDNKVLPSTFGAWYGMSRTGSIGYFYNKNLVRHR